MTEQKSISARAWVAMLALGAIWGASFVSIRIALDEIGPLTSVAHRTFWAMLVLWGVVLVMRIPLPRDLRTWGAFFVMGLLNNMIPFTLMAWGQLHVASGLTSIFNAATAIFGVLAAAVFFADERLTLRKIIGVLLGFAGVTTAIGLSNLAEFNIRSLAQLAILAGTVSYALAAVWARTFLAGLRPQMAAAGMLTGSSLISVPLAVAVEGPVSLALQPDTLLAIGYYSVIATALAYLLYYHVLSLAGSGNLMLVTLIIPPVAITLGALLRAEQLASNAWAGFALLALGMIVLDGRLPRRISRARARAG
ncbi:DMT family transporter [Roseobacter sp.]|uniref:DMT family transporter n=1 Tax=Roseobacter sp. TaxID=1907202 RepID=UPI0025E9B69D|nr:DMT family transporter [Roseobacter sp.]